MSPRLFAGAVLALVTAAVVTGLYAVGGPQEARRERSDQHRYEALIRLAEALACRQGRLPPSSLPMQLSVASVRAHCEHVRIDESGLTDRETGQPFSYVRRSDRAFSVCSSFHNARRTMDQRRPRPPTGLIFDPQSGCISGYVR